MLLTNELKALQPIGRGYPKKVICFPEGSGHRVVEIALDSDGRAYHARRWWDNVQYGTEQEVLPTFIDLMHNLADLISNYGMAGTQHHRMREWATAYVGDRRRRILEFQTLNLDAVCLEPQTDSSGILGVHFCFATPFQGPPSIDPSLMAYTAKAENLVDTYISQQ
jgi:hypothetical protein